MLRYDRHGKLKPYKEPWLASALEIIATISAVVSIGFIVYGLSENNFLTVGIALGGLVSSLFIDVFGRIYAHIHYSAYLQEYMLFVLIPEGRFFTRDMGAVQGAAPSGAQEKDAAPQETDND